jgi:hypothetical protein
VAHGGRVGRISCTAGAARAGEALLAGDDHGVAAGRERDIRPVDGQFTVMKKVSTP